MCKVSDAGRFYTMYFIVWAASTANAADYVKFDLIWNDEIHRVIGKCVLLPYGVSKNGLMGKCGSMQWEAMHPISPFSVPVGQRLLQLSWRRPRMDNIPKGGCPYKFRWTKTCSSVAKVMIMQQPGISTAAHVAHLHRPQRRSKNFRMANR